MSWRPRNETPEDLARENAARVVLEGSFDATFTKLSEGLYCIDWAISRNGKVVALGEFKRRFNNRTAYETLYVSAAKVEAGERLASHYSLPFFLFIQWDDGLFYTKSTNRLISPLIINGNSRGQNGDIEPLVEYPISKFREIHRP